MPKIRHSGKFFPKRNPMVLYKRSKRTNASEEISNPDMWAIDLIPNNMSGIHDYNQSVSSISNSETSTLSDSVSYMSLKLAADTIPKFDGESISIEYFIKKAKIAENSVKPSERTHIRTLIISKITGNAHDLVQDLNDLEEIFETLKTCYAKFQDLDDIENELRSLKQEQNEKISQFCARIRNIVNRGVSLAEATMSSDELPATLKSLSKKANKSFVKGIRELNISSRVSDKDPQTLDASLKLALHIEREMERRNEHFGPQETSVSQPRAESSGGKFLRVNKISSQSQIRRCFTCDSPDHMIRDCPIRKLNENNPANSKFGKPGSSKCPHCSKNHGNAPCLFKAREEGKQVCFTCKKIGHNDEKCYRKQRNVPLETQQNKKHLNSQSAPLNGAQGSN